MSDWLDVLVFASITAVATGLGVIPFAIVRDLPKTAVGVAHALAAGLMLGASFRLTYEGFSGGEALWRTVFGAVAGLAFVTLTRALISKKGWNGFAGLRGVKATRALLILGVMTLHSAAEGVGVGVSFGGGRVFGTFITIAIAIHNIPEGMTISLAMVPRGTPLWQAAGWSVFSSLPQPLMAVPAFLFVDAFEFWLPVGLGFAAGAMVWMVFAELVPEALENVSPRWVASITTFSLLAMQVMQAVLRV